jgi:hypothetical protein
LPAGKFQPRRPYRAVTDSSGAVDVDESIAVSKPGTVFAHKGTETLVLLLPREKLLGKCYNKRDGMKKTLSLRVLDASLLVMGLATTFEPAGRGCGHRLTFCCWPP